MVRMERGRWRRRWDGDEDGRDGGVESWWVADRDNKAKCELRMRMSTRQAATEKQTVRRSK